MSDGAPALTLFDLRYGKFVRGLDEERQCSAHKPARANSAKAMNETILLLASDWGIRNVICKALESQGYSVLSASNLGAAADLLKAHTFDLLMVRPYTESVSGHDAAKYLRRQCPEIPVLIVAGLLDDVELEDREALQEFEVFPKPFKAVELLDKVKEVLLKCSLRDRPDRRLE